MLEIYYDSWCPICTGIRARLERWDWLGRLSYRSIRECGAAQALGVPAELLEQRMHVRFVKSGRVAGGIDAVAAIAASVPLLMPLWPLLRLAGAIGLGQVIYDAIASRRTVIPVGACGETGCPR